MTKRELEIHYRTRDRRFLLRGALAIGLVLGLIGLMAGVWHVPRPGLPTVRGDDTVFSIEESIRRGHDAGSIADTIRDLATNGEGSSDHRRRQAEAFIVGSGVPAGDASRLTLLADALLGDATARTQAFDALKKAAACTPVRRFDREWLADVLSHRQEFDAARAGYESEGLAFPEAARARNRAFELAINRSDTVQLRRLLEDHTMTTDVSLWLQARAQALCRNYGGLVGAVMRGQMSHPTSWFQPALSLFCGALWWMIFARIAGVPPRQWWLALPAIALGIFATTLTLVGQIVLPITFDQDGDFLQRVLFFTIGVGLREETFKLLCALPLVVLLRKEKSANVVLIALSAVGLGFAIEENTGYFEAGLSPAWGRFLTANFLHLAWTGMLGYSLWRACRGPARAWEHVFGTFLLVVLSHGAYDLCLGSFLDESLSLFSVLIFVGVAFRYFTLLRSVAELSCQVVSPLAVFIFGSAAVLGLNFAGLCWGIGLRWGTPIFLSEALCMAPTAFLFIREFRHD